MNRLWVRLTLAFALVVLVTVGAIGLLADLTAGQAFRQYLSYSDIARFENLVDLLAEYYQAQGSWDGVDAILQQVRIVSGGHAGHDAGPLAGHHRVGRRTGPDHPGRRRRARGL